MDGTRFDRLTRTLTTTGSRRRALGGLLSGALGVLSSGAEHTTAKKKKPCPPCKKRKQGKCKKKLPDGTACAGGICQNGNCVAQGAGGGSRQPPPPPAGTCIDGVKNGSETGVDCGGECFRCGLGETCASRDDCQNAHCLNGTCQQCTADSQCPDDAHGACVCDIFRVCRQRDGITANNCGECPPDWHSCSPGNPSATCYLRCGVTEPCAPTANYCTSGTERCGDNGHCLQPVNHGKARCGVHDGSSDGSMCECASDQECVRRTGNAGAFCAKVNGSFCSCPIPVPGGGFTGSTTFCVTPR